MACAAARPQRDLVEMGPAGHVGSAHVLLAGQVGQRPSGRADSALSGDRQAVPGEGPLSLDASAVRRAVGEQPVVGQAGEGPAQVPGQRPPAAAVGQAFRAEPRSTRPFPQEVPADLPLALIDPQCPAVKAHQGHVVQLLRVCSGRVRDPGGFFFSQRDRPVSRYRELTDAVLDWGGESEVAEHVAETGIQPVGEGLKPRVQRLPRQRGQADREGPRKRHDRPVPCLACQFWW